MLRKINSSLYFILIITLGLIIKGQPQELRKSGRFWIGKINKSFKVEKGGILAMDDIRGDATIQTWEKNEVNIHEVKKMDIFTKAEAEAAMQESETGYAMQGNTVRISGPAFDRKWIQSTFKIFIPVEFNCDIKTQGGDLNVTGPKGSVKAITGGGDIELFEINGPVDVKTGGGDIEITKTTRKVNAKTGGGDVEIKDSRGPVKISTGGGDITVVETKDSVDISTGGGDVEIRENQGGVNVRTGGGDIEIIGSKGDVVVRTGGGDIQFEKVTGTFQAVTGGGDIQVQEVHGNIAVKTGGGDVNLENILGAVEVTTGGGDVNTEITIKDFSKDHHVEIKTGGGDINLTLPEKLPATIQAEIKIHQRKWEDYEITSDFPLKITTEDKDLRYRIIRATGDINGGGDLINLKTGGGDIHIRKFHQ